MKLILDGTDLLTVLTDCFIKIINAIVWGTFNELFNEFNEIFFSFRLHIIHSHPKIKKNFVDGSELLAVSSMTYLHLKDERLNHPYYNFRFLWILVP